MAPKRISKQIDTTPMMAESRTEIMLPVVQSSPKTGREIVKWSVWKTLLETATPTGVLQGNTRFSSHTLRWLWPLLENRRSLSNYRIQAIWTTNEASWAQSCRANMILKSWKKNRWLCKSSKTRRSLYLRETFRHREDLVPSTFHKASISKTSKSPATPDNKETKVLWDIWNVNLVPKQALNTSQTFNNLREIRCRHNQLSTESRW